MKVKVLVVDDTALFRKIVSDAISNLPYVEIVGTAANGQIAMRRIKELSPDLLILDIEMPVMDGFSVLEAIKNEGLDVGVIMLSSLTIKGSDLTIKALSLGAFDFITKPMGSSSEENLRSITNNLAPMILAFAKKREIKSILKGKEISSSYSPQEAPDKSQSSDLSSIRQRMRKITENQKPEMVIIGISTGGPSALSEMLPKLPSDINVPILIVQHMPATFTQSLANSLDAKCAIQVKEAMDNEIILPNIAYIAPGGKQMKLIPENGNKVIRITDDPPENSCKPSVDYLFRSIANHFPGKATAVIMTGMGKDGTSGLKLIKENGGITIAQDEESCVVFGMPKEAISAGAVDVIAPLNKIADEILKTIKKNWV